MSFKMSNPPDGHHHPSMYSLAPEWWGGGLNLSPQVILSPLLTELQKVGILVSRILDISGRKSGHFHIVAANLSILGIKKYNIVNI